MQKLGQLNYWQAEDFRLSGCWKHMRPPVEKALPQDWFCLRLWPQLLLARSVLWPCSASALLRQFLPAWSWPVLTTSVLRQLLQLASSWPFTSVEVPWQLLQLASCCPPWVVEVQCQLLQLASSWLAWSVEVPWQLLQLASSWPAWSVEVPCQLLQLASSWPAWSVEVPCQLLQLASSWPAWSVEVPWQLLQLASSWPAWSVEVPCQLLQLASSWPAWSVEVPCQLLQLASSWPAWSVEVPCQLLQLASSWPAWSVEVPCQLLQLASSWPAWSVEVPWQLLQLASSWPAWSVEVPWQLLQLASSWPAWSVEVPCQLLQLASSWPAWSVEVPWQLLQLASSWPAWSVEVPCQLLQLASSWPAWSVEVPCQLLQLASSWPLLAATFASCKFSNIRSVRNASEPSSFAGSGLSPSGSVCGLLASSATFAIEPLSLAGSGFLPSVFAFVCSLLAFSGTEPKSSALPGQKTFPNRSVAVPCQFVRLATFWEMSSCPACRVFILVSFVALPWKLIQSTAGSYSGLGLAQSSGLLASWEWKTVMLPALCTSDSLWKLTVSELDCVQRQISWSFACKANKSGLTRVHSPFSFSFTMLGRCLDSSFASFALTVRDSTSFMTSRSMEDASSNLPLSRSTLEKKRLPNERKSMAAMARTAGRL